MPIHIEDARNRVEKTYIGFGPNSTQIKPAHLANGLFRSVLGQTYQTRTLNRFVFTNTNKGEIPKGHQLEEVYDMLMSEQKISSEDVSKQDLQKLRTLLKTVVNADDAVYNNGMEAYSAGSAGFVTKDGLPMYDGGMFIAEWLRRNNSPLYAIIKESLGQTNDVISIACSPLLESEGQAFSSSDYDYDKMSLLNNPSASVLKYQQGLLNAAKNLTEHLKHHPNKFFRLRL